MATIKEIFTKDAKFAQILRQVKIIATTNAGVLITGETGTGKESIAEMLFKQSQRAGHTFTLLNCAAISPELLEPILFGYVKGAYTDALDDTQGLIEATHKGTLFLDEINSLPLAMQAKLLRVIETGEYLPVGSVTQRKADVRIIAATNASIPLAIEQGEFRADLYFRLSVFTIDLPPLRERHADIRLLFTHYLNFFASKYNVRCLDVKEEVLLALESYPWPGNIRELRNLAENLTIFHRKRTLSLPHIPSRYKKYQINTIAPLYFELPEFGCDLLKVELSLLCQALENAEGNINRAANLLGLTRHTLYYRIKKFGQNLLVVLSEKYRLQYQHLIV